jgi:predicted peptidase
MNRVPRFFVIAHLWSLESLLPLASVLLIAQLCWPTIRHWWRVPAPGRIGFDTFATTTLADEFTIQLPLAYHERATWPLIVFLHGSGQRGNNPKILQHETVFRRELPAIVVAPQCLPSVQWEPEAVFDFIRYVVSNYHVDAKRIYLVGYSMGGYGTWATVAAHPELFAAIVPIAGGGNPNDARVLTSTPVWAFHGENDNIVPLANSQQMINAIRDAGGDPHLTILPSAGHSICRKVCELAGLWEWLFAQRRLKSPATLQK